MRSPVIAFGLFAAAAVSPTLVSAAPASQVPAVPVVPALPASPGLPDSSTAGNTLAPATNNAKALPVSSATQVRRELDRHHSKHHKNKHERRIDDYRTAGGNAYSGASGNVSGGNTVNNAQDEDDTIRNTNSSMLGGVKFCASTDYTCLNRHRWYWWRHLQW